MRNKLIANGSHISIGTSVKRLVSYVIKKVSNRDELKSNLNWLKVYAEDIVFNREFCKHSGDKVLVDYVIQADSNEERASILTVLLSLIDDQVTSYCNIIGKLNAGFTSFLIDCLEKLITVKKETEMGKKNLTFQEEIIRQDDRDLEEDEIIVQKCLALLERGLAENCHILPETSKLLFSTDKIYSRLSVDIPITIQIAALNFINQVLLRCTEKGERRDIQFMNKLRQNVLAVARQDVEDQDLRSSVAFFQVKILESLNSNRLFRICCLQIITVKPSIQKDQISTMTWSHRSNQTWISAAGIRLVKIKSYFEFVNQIF